MKTVGLRELKNHLSEYVRYVRDGETVSVTDRGEVVAELVPPRRQEGIPSGLEEMATRGEVRLGKRLTRAARTRLYKKMPPIGGDESALEILDWLRGER
ncbi:MAG TPA: type II toxin-antitoxin system prevent-host-death family antitoxin [Rhizomicrobium sp.]